MFLKRNTALHATAYILYMNYIFELFILMSIYLTIQKIYSFPMNWLLQTKHNLYLPNQASNWQTCYSVLYNIITCRRVTTSGVTYSLMKKSMALAIGKCPISLSFMYLLFTQFFQGLRSMKSSIEMILCHIFGIHMYHIQHLLVLQKTDIWEM